MCCVCCVLGHSGPVHQCARSMCPVCRVLGHLAPVYRCAPSVCCVACAVSLATLLLFSGVHAGRVLLCVQCPWPLGSCLPVCCCVCGVLSHFAPVHRCSRSVCCVACAVSLATCHLCTGVHARCVVCAMSLATWLLFTGVYPWFALCAVSLANLLLSTGVPRLCVVLRVRCPWPLGYWSPYCTLGVLCCMCCVLGHLAPVHRCARSVCCALCAVSLATGLLFTAVHTRCVVLRVRCPEPLGSCSPVCTLGVLCYVCRVLAHLAPVHQCARSVCCVACAVSWATWLLFTGGQARCVVLRVRFSGPFGSCSSVCTFRVWCCVCVVVGHLAPVQRCCTLGLLCILCAALDHLAPVHRCARSVCCVACAVSWAAQLLFPSEHGRCFVLCVWCPGPLGCCSPVCTLCVLCCACGFLGHLAPVHPCARSVCCVACAVSWATWLLFTGVHPPCVVLRARCPG